MPPDAVTLALLRYTPVPELDVVVPTIAMGPEVEVKVPASINTAEPELELALEPVMSQMLALKLPPPFPSQTPLTTLVLVLLFLPATVAVPPTVKPV